MQHERRTRRLLRLATMVVLIGAILPNVFFIGHLPIPGVAAENEYPLTSQEVRAHASHCHYDPAGCSDHSHPSTSSWWLAGDTRLATPSTVRTTSIVSEDTEVPQVIPTPPEKPPQIL